MALAIKPQRSLKREVTRVVRKELGDAADRLLKRRRTDDDVHEARKCVKKAEAVASLIRRIGGRVPARDRKDLRKARRALSRVRDADADIQAFDRLQSRFPGRIPARASSAIRRRLLRRKTDLVPTMRAGAGSLADAGQTLMSLRRSAKKWAPSFDLADLPDVWKHGYRVCLEAMEQAADTGRSDDFHAWRKAVKTLWYQLRMAERLVAGLTKQIAEFRTLETALGDEHNLAVLRIRLTRDHTLRRERTGVEDVAALAAVLEDELRRAALVLGERLFKMSPRKFSRDLERRLRPHGTARRELTGATRGRAVEVSP